VGNEPEKKGTRGWFGFIATLLVANGGGAALVALVTNDPLISRAVWTSAAVAAGVQLVGFGFARYLMAKDKGIFLAWAAALSVRFASLLVYGLLVFKVFGHTLVPAPTLISFAIFLLATSVAEPLFLNA